MRFTEGGDHTSMTRPAPRRILVPAALRTAAGLSACAVAVVLLVDAESSEPGASVRDDAGLVTQRDVAVTARSAAAVRRRATAPGSAASGVVSAEPSSAATRLDPSQSAPEILDSTDRAMCEVLLELLRLGEPGVRRFETLALADETVRTRTMRLRPRRSAEETNALRDGLAAALASREPSMRVFALRVTAVRGDDADVEPAARAAVADPSADVRVVAAEMLGARSAVDRATLGALRQAALDDDARVRRTALDALSTLSEDDDAESLYVRALADADAPVRQAAARALGRRPRCGSGARLALSGARSDRDPDVASAASRALLDLSTR